MIRGLLRLNVFRTSHWFFPFIKIKFWGLSLVKHENFTVQHAMIIDSCRDYVLTCAGANSKYVSTDGNDFSSSSSKVSSFSVPQTPRSEGEILQSINVKSFSFAELKTSTRNFRPDSVLGEGGFGSVFKGWIDENTFAAAKPGTGIIIAVKRLNQESFQGHKEWLVS